MAETEYWCPRGDGPLTRNTANGVHETCDSCHGFAVTIWLLDEMLVDGVGPHVWQASHDAPADGDPCPACRQNMAQVESPTGSAGQATVEVCRDCELVWVSAEAEVKLAVKNDLTPVGPAAPGCTHCPACGAPYSDADQGRCPFCKAVIEHPALTVTAPELGEREAQARARPRGSSDWVDDFIDTSSQRPSLR
jgi:hypothetical protein